jgi:hypothetical protein
VAAPETIILNWGIATGGFGVTYGAATVAGIGVALISGAGVIEIGVWVTILGY